MSKFKLLSICFLIICLCSPSASGSAGNVIQDGPPNWEVEGDQEGALFGLTVSDAGDVNCDGYDDVIVGAKFYDNAPYTDSGKIFVFYGSEDGLSSTPDWTAVAPVQEFNGYFGAVVASAGDINGDGCADIMASMPNHNNGVSDAGAVYVWHGSASGLGTSPNWYAEHTTTYAHLGWSMGSAGDVSGDGYDDIIVGAYRYDAVGASDAYVWYGSATGLGANGTPTNADWTVHESAIKNGFGSRVGTAGDVNGDGFDDVYVGAPDFDNVQVDEGKVFVWYGSSTGLPESPIPESADWAAESNQTGARFSCHWSSGPDNGCVGTAGDINGDGYDDFMIGSYEYDHSDGEGDEGTVFMWYGSATGLNEGVHGDPANAGWVVETTQESARLGTGVSKAGDFNGDGRDDVMMSAYLYDYNEVPNSGLVVMWYGREEGLHNTASVEDYDWMNAPPYGGSAFGWVLSNAGDVNGDGVDDIIVGAPYHDGDLTDVGTAVVWYGNSLAYLYLPMIVK